MATDNSDQHEQTEGTERNKSDRSCVRSISASQFTASGRDRALRRPRRPGRRRGSPRSVGLLVQVLFPVPALPPPAYSSASSLSSCSKVNRNDDVKIEYAGQYVRFVFA